METLLINVDFLMVLEANVIRYENRFYFYITILYVPNQFWLGSECGAFIQFSLQSVWAVAHPSLGEGGRGGGGGVGERETESQM